MLGKHFDQCREAGLDKPHDKSRLQEMPDDNIQHVYPTFGREHVTDKRDDCWCQPKVQFVKGGAIVIHEAEQ